MIIFAIIIGICVGLVCLTYLWVDCMICTEIRYRERTLYGICEAKSTSAELEDEHDAPGNKAVFLYNVIL